TPGKGLEGVVAAETAISDIDGKKGVLSYVGYDIHDLAPNATFEETIYLLHHLELPTPAQLDELRQQLGREREPNDLAMKLMPYLAENCAPMSMLRTAVSASSAKDPDGWDTSSEANYRKAIRLCAVLPTMVAYYDRLRKGEGLVAPDQGLSQAANFLYMLKGDKADDESARIFDVCLILHADHTMNASTFAARVCAATLSDIHSAITAAIAALKGPLHGGANEQVMRMIKEIKQLGGKEKARDYTINKLRNKEKVMGFGHRVYKTEDPRATHLRKMAKELADKTGDPSNFEISQEIEKAVMDEKGIYPNVDFYAASVYGYLQIPTDLFTPVFACSRVAGWTAHVREQYADNRLIRPDHEYVGPPPREWKALSQR
ncbi:MAG TPA: citrate/2-methylcitrate synthase, partial [Actinomycetota bacterium]|nr:citrate/2-methylcitrate synthase [Actinomycetota bacterium]